MKTHAVTVFSSDDSIATLIGNTLDDSWRVEQCADPEQLRAVLAKPNVAIVVLDDQAVEEPAREWLLGQVRKRTPRALVAYIASNNSPDVERRARANGIHYYTSRPIDPELMLKIVRSFAAAAVRQNRLDFY